jgi:peptide/nickel transport system permease protein
MDREGLATDILRRNMAPSSEHLMGTDILGRDMLTRVIIGLYVSLKIGVLAAVFSSIIALVLGIISATAGKIIDAVITALVDMFMSVPHIVLLILIAFSAGGGVRGVIIAVALSHWPRMTRVIRAEIMQIRSSNYVQISYKLGRNKLWVAINHMAGYVVNQFVSGDDPAVSSRHSSFCGIGHFSDLDWILTILQ